MAKSLLVSLAFLLGATAHPVEERAPLVPNAQAVHPLSRTIQSRPNATLADRYRHFRALAADASQGGPAGVGAAVAAQNQVEYLIDVQANGTGYKLIIDTGSSDTWFVKTGFQCLDSYRRSVAASYCNFGPQFKGSFPGGQIANQHFNITYGSANGPFLNGQMGYSDLTVAGVNIPKQQIALATTGSWNGDGISSGILGLGLPGLTEAFTGNNPANDGLANVVQYNPLVTTVSSQLGNSIFSLGLSRNQSESFLALGGVPANVKVGNYTSTPMVKMARRSGGSDYFYYTINPDKMVWNSSTLKGSADPSPQVIVDSGTTLNLLPYNVASAINAQFTPHAVLDPEQGGWFVPCNAVPPSLGVQIGGQMLWTDPASMILPEVRDPVSGYCASGIGATDSPPYILGDVFMQGLVSVFDIGTTKMEMRFAKRL